MEVRIYHLFINTMLLLLISKLCGYFHPLSDECVFSPKGNELRVS